MEIEQECVYVASTSIIYVLFQFLVILSSSSGSVFILGDNPTYNCASSSDIITSVEWLVNGTRLEDLSLTNVETEFSQLSRQGTLVFMNISVEYNNTNIQCRATLSNGDIVDSNNDTLLVQGERELLVMSSSKVNAPLLL